MPVVCPDPIVQIFNARTFRCVKHTGRLGHLAAQLEAEGAQMDCPNEKALNPLSGRCKYILSYYQRRKAARAAAIAAARSPSPARAVLIARQSRSPPLLVAARPPLVAARPPLVEADHLPLLVEAKHYLPVM